MIHTRSSLPFFVIVYFLLALFLAGCSTSKKTTRPPANTSGLTERQLRREVVRYAEQWVGASYKYAGTEPRTGFDCSGFTSYVLKQFDVALSPSSAAQSKQGTSVGLNAVQPGDILVFGKNPRNIQHVALVVDRGREGIEVVHSTTSRGVVRENVSVSGYWQPLILFARDVIGRR